MPVFLPLLVCVLGGSACHVVVPTERPFIGLAPCQVEGMMTAATWTGAHPGWRVARVRCSIGSRPHDEGRA